MERMEKKLKSLLKKGWTYVNGIKEFHEFAAYVEEHGYEIENGQMIGRKIKVKLIPGE
jgi:hypothetical protein